MKEWTITSIERLSYSRGPFYVATAYSGDRYFRSASNVSKHDAEDRVMESMISRTPYNMLYTSQ